MGDTCGDRTVFDFINVNTQLRYCTTDLQDVTGGKWVQTMRRLWCFLQLRVHLQPSTK